jgi:hypothetical protein
VTTTGRFAHPWHEFGDSHLLLSSGSAEPDYERPACRSASRSSRLSQLACAPSFWSLGLHDVCHGRDAAVLGQDHGLDCLVVRPPVEQPGGDGPRWPLALGRCPGMSAPCPPGPSRARQNSRHALSVTQQCLHSWTSNANGQRSASETWPMVRAGRAVTCSLTPRRRRAVPVRRVPARDENEASGRALVVLPLSCERAGRGA